MRTLRLELLAGIYPKTRVQWKKRQRERERERIERGWRTTIVKRGKRERGKEKARKNGDALCRREEGKRE